MKKHWTYKVRKRGTNGQTIVFKFLGVDMMEFRWYPPWQNELMRGNAKCICDDLNKGCKERNVPNGR